MRKSANPVVIRVIVVAMVLVLGSQTVQSQESKKGADGSAYNLSTLVYKVVDDHSIRADVYRAPGEDIRPALVFIHGGALIVGTREWLWPWQLQRYLDAGFVVVSIDYRLAPETKLPGIVEDVEDAYMWLRTEGPDLFKIDPNRVAFVGQSAGGYLTLVAGFRLIPRPKALVSFYGYGDLAWFSHRPSTPADRMPAISRADALATVGESVISSAPVQMISSPPMQFSEDSRMRFVYHCRQQGIWPREVTGHDPNEERAWFADYEPLRNVSADYPPTLLLHGEKDTNVPFERSAMMIEALRRHKVPNELISNPDWEHMFDFLAEDRAVQEAFTRVVEFLKKHSK